MTRRHVLLAVFAILALVAAVNARADGTPPPVTAAAPPNPAVTVQSIGGDPNAALIVVVDPVREAMAVYFVNRTEVRLISTRHLQKDLTAPEASGPSPQESASLPSADVPGQDPPSFVRPKKAVRTGSEYTSLAPGSDVWRATYLVQGSLFNVYEDLKTAYASWRLIKETAGENRAPSSAYRNDNRGLDFTVTTRPGAPGWVNVVVSEDRQPK